MAHYGFEQKSFQDNKVRFLFVLNFLVVVYVWAIFLSPEHGGFYPDKSHTDLLIDFINIGQGDSILVRTPRGKNFLIDGGTNVPATQARSQNRELVQGYLRKTGVKRIDGIVVTHPHNDHLGGIIQVLKQFKVKKVWENGVVFNTVTYKDYVEICEKKRVPREVVKSGDILDWGDELFVEVLHPNQPLKPRDLSNTEMNNSSVALFLRFGLFSILFPGDVEEASEMEISKYGKDLKCQVIKVPHHGSSTSIFKTFLNFVSPEAGVIQVGKDNPFRHPTREMLELYQERGIRVWRNDRHGTVRLTVGGKDPKDFNFMVDRGL
ncbi:MBL fold metallo-hydrolase [bacterium]|nr:MBL fold metallo-hydrolase [bacterium]